MWYDRDQVLMGLLVEHFGTPIYVDGPETIRRGLRYVTRLEPRLPVNRRAINLEVLTFYADGPVVPGSIGRAIERSRMGEMADPTPPAAPGMRDSSDGPPRDSMQWPGSSSESVPKSALSSLAETSYDARAVYEPTRTSRAAYSSLHGNGTYASRYGTDTYRPSSSAAAAVISSTRLPLTLGRNDDEAVYRRVTDSESREGGVVGWRRPLQPRGLAGPWDAREESRTRVPSPSSVEMGGSLRLPRGYYAPPPPQQQQHQRPGDDYAPHHAAPTLPPAIMSERSSLVQPLPPSRFTSQMHIPPFRGDGQEG